ncbi:MAG: hydroxymethylbilane synthase, partial [Bacteroidota bacterium]
MNKRIIIGSRSSRLALWQANFIKTELENFFPEIIFEIKEISTLGDQIQDKALYKIGDKGLFTKEIESALLNEEIDIAVHSMKDLQTEIPEGLAISAVTERHDPRDVIISREKGVTLDNLSKNARVATGSLRRSALLCRHRPDVQIRGLRGNVPTRIRKYLDSDWDAIILAKAGVERLEMQNYISSVIEKDLFIPAVGQGALGVQIRADDSRLMEISSKLNHQKTETEVKAERSFLKTVSGGCQAPVAAHGEITPDSVLIFDAMIASTDGIRFYREKGTGSPEEAEMIGREIAMELLGRGAPVDAIEGCHP